MIGTNIEGIRVHQALNQPTEAARVAAEAVRIAKDSAGLAGGNPTELYNVACTLALSIPLTEGEPRQALAAEAVRTLKNAIAAGWSNAQHTSHDPDLDPLRDRDDFRRLLAELFDRTFPADPFAR